jgi:RimJ/RimL family protein N-acetyltransferase
MRCNGKWIYLENHSVKNLDKMYEWSKDNELINIELGKNRDIDKSDYANDIMESYIENNHEANSSFCHFGIHRMYNDELIGYVDFQNIDEELNDAELSLSIPDKKYRNKHYGIDAAIAAMMYGIMTRKIKNITMRTRIDNDAVKNVCEKLGIEYAVDHWSGNGYDIDIIVYKINEETLLKILSKVKITKAAR